MITVTGDFYLVNEPTMKYMENGTAMTYFRARSPEGKDEVIWVSITMFGKQAEIANQYLNKGSGIQVTGRLRHTEGNPETYKASDGSSKASFGVICDRFSFLSGKKPEATQE